MWVAGIAGLLAAGGAGMYAAERVNVSRRVINELSQGYNNVSTCLLAGITLPKALSEQEYPFFSDIANKLRQGLSITDAWGATPPLPKDFAIVWKAAGEALAWQGPEYLIRVQNANDALKNTLTNWEQQNHKRGALWLKLGWLGGAALMCLLW